MVAPPGRLPASWATRETRNATASSCPTSLPGHPHPGHRPLGDTISQGQSEATAGQARTRTPDSDRLATPLPIRLQVKGTGGSHRVGQGAKQSNTRLSTQACPVQGSQVCPNSHPGTRGTAARPPGPTVPPTPVPRAPHCTREDTDTSEAPGPCQARAGRSA